MFKYPHLSRSLNYAHINQRTYSETVNVVLDCIIAVVCVHVNLRPDCKNAGESLFSIHIETIKTIMMGSTIISFEEVQDGTSKL